MNITTVDPCLVDRRDGDAWNELIDIQADDVICAATPAFAAEEGKLPKGFHQKDLYKLTENGMDSMLWIYHLSAAGEYLVQSGRVH